MSRAVAFLTGWAADIRASSGTSVDADSLEEAASIITSQADEITRLSTALSEAERRARREALEEADAIVAKALSEGSDIPPKAVKHIVGIRSAIRALIPSEPHDAEGRN